MNTRSHDFITVDMRGLKAALVERAHAERTSVSVLVRRAVAMGLGLTDQHEHEAIASTEMVSVAATAKLSIRFTHAEVEQLTRSARDAGMSRGAYLAGLLAEVPVLLHGTGRTRHVSELACSSAELSTLIRNIHHLTTLLRLGSVRAAQEYRQMLDGVADDVRAHLAVAAAVLADLQPRQRNATRAHRSIRSRKGVEHA